MATHESYRPVLPLTRLGLGLGVVLSFLAGTSLFVLSRDTDRFFAWTIAVPITAAFVGVFYYLAVVVAAVSVRRQEWAMARVGIPGVLVFLWATSLTTLRHLDLFHLGDGPTSGQVVAWIWLVIYVVDPVLLTVAFVQQVRLAGEDRPRRRRLTGAYRTALVLVGVGSSVIGVSMFLAPAWVNGWWLWPLTALTGRIVAAWLMASGVVLLTMAHEDDVDRIRPMTLAMIVYAVLQFVVLARFGDELVGGGARWRFAVFALVALALGVAGLTGRTAVPAEDHAGG